MEEPRVHAVHPENRRHHEGQEDGISDKRQAVWEKDLAMIRNLVKEANQSKGQE